MKPASFALIRERMAILTPRFWLRVKKYENGCWEWQGKKRGGYGRFYVGGKRWIQSHRFAHELLIGPVPDDKILDHLCRNRACVNPWHLEITTDLINAQRGESPGAIAHRANMCQKGHPYTPEITILTKDGAQQCRLCLNKANRERKRLRWATDATFRETTKTRNNTQKRERYKNDPVYREHILQYNREQRQARQKKSA